MSYGCTTGLYCNLGALALISCRPFSDGWKLLATSVPSDMQQRAKALVAFHVSKAYSPASAYGNCCWELYLRGCEAGVLLRCSGLEEEKGCQNNSCVPSGRKRAAKGSFQVMESKFTQVPHCNVKALVFRFPLSTPLHLYNSYTTVTVQINSN